MQRFTDVLDAAEELAVDEKEELIRILQNRLIESKRRQLQYEVKKSEREFELGLCKVMTPEEFMKEISS